MVGIHVNTIADEAGTGGPDFVAMPTVGGAPIVESGSNSDGEWTRWANGEQLVRLYLDANNWVTSANVFNDYASFYKDVAFPLGFIDDKWVAAGAASHTNFGIRRFLEAVNVTGTGSARISQANYGSVGIFPLRVNITGRWK